MVIGLLMITAIPTVIGIVAAVSEQKKQNENNNDEKLLRKFTLVCWCEDGGPDGAELHGGKVVLGNDKVWIQSPSCRPRMTFHTFCGFYIAYPDEDRPKPPPIGLVSTVSDDPPLLNWIYVDKITAELKYGNRTQSKPHRVGSWNWTTELEEGEFMNEEEAGGLLLDGEENFVIVEPESGRENDGRWEVRWDRRDDGLRDVAGVKGRKVFRISLERTFVEEKPKKKEASGIETKKDGRVAETSGTMRVDKK